MTKDTELSVLEKSVAVLHIDSADDVEVAKAYERYCTDKITEITEYFTPLKRTAKEAHQNWVQAEKDSLKPYKAIKAKVRALVSAYQKKLDAVVEANEDALVKPVVSRKFWKFEIVDVDKVPREYMTPDLKAIGVVVRAKKDKAGIPGVRAFYDY